MSKERIRHRPKDAECDCDRCMSALHSGDGGYNPYMVPHVYRRVRRTPSRPSPPNE